MVTVFPMLTTPVLPHLQVQFSLKVAVHDSNWVPVQTMAGCQPGLWLRLSQLL